MSPLPRRDRYLSLHVLGQRKRPVPSSAPPEPPPNSVIDWGWYVDGIRQPAPDVATAARRAVAEKQGFVWLGLKDPTDADLHALPQQFDLHPLAIEDAVEGHTRSKMEMFGDDMFMVISTVAYVDHQHLTDTAEVVSTGQVMIFLNEHFSLGALAAMSVVAVSILLGRRSKISVAKSKTILPRDAELVAPRS